ncbi:MAG: hypothetical protein MZV63_17740 [Marinilabiliales bacterium]|nr:hypothetical protein [Marinilabiliales bacterium]
MSEASVPRNLVKPFGITCFVLPPEIENVTEEVDGLCIMRCLLQPCYNPLLALDADQSLRPVPR